ncbi:restriction endonuclease subunit S [Phascolarctobacterium succinatutens]|uniref:restriction endonuclease subunit S n=1 Tax=Phascolarctobacterium succinatutens TaxID=626940 RepID=UPI0026EF0CCD|nr:restriction endonuclease subunit S [Phascolarctobacterium succinatutens]
MPKKKTALTIEERLQQALVPAEEQPYEVPENWVWVRLGEVNKYMSKSVNPISEPNKTFELYSVPSMADNYPEIIVGSDIGSSKQSVCKGDVLLCKINPRINRVWKVSQFTDNELIASSEWIILRNNHIDANYLMYCFQSKYFREFMLSNVSGVGGSLMRAQPKYVQTYPIPLPPLSEQQRIVERIEELFVKLDEAKERLQEAADSFAVRKAAILHKAFTGELIGKQVTELVPLENIVDLIKIGPFGSSLHESDYIENGIPLVNPKHIVQQHIVPQSKISISDEKAEELSSYKLKENDIVLGRRGEMGRCAPISNREENWICGTGSMIIRLKKEYDAKLYSLILGSQATVTYLENSAVGSTLKNLNEKIVRKIPVPQFSSEEQHEIVRLIDDLLARERSAQQATEQALASIDLMKKSILARAFRGELGTNKASEASALELLQQVLAEN